MVDAFDRFAMLLALIKGEKTKKEAHETFPSPDLPKSFLSTVLQYTNYLLCTSFSTDKTTSEPL